MPPAGGKSRKSGSGVGGRPAQARPAQAGGGGRQQNPRQPTSNRFSQTWTCFGHISPADKMEILERVEPRCFSKDALNQYSRDDNALDAMLCKATGWQPGHELIEHDRELFFKAVHKRYADLAYPLRGLTPSDAIKEVQEAFGLAPALAYALDVDPDGRPFISNGVFSEPLPITGRRWDIVGPPAGQGPEYTVVTDGVDHYYAFSFFQADDRAGESRMQEIGMQQITSTPPRLQPEAHQGSPPPMGSQFQQNPPRQHAPQGVINVLPHVGPLPKASFTGQGPQTPQPLRTFTGPPMSQPGVAASSPGSVMSHIPQLPAPTRAVASPSFQQGAMPITPRMGSLGGGTVPCSWSLGLASTTAKTPSPAQMDHRRCESPQQMLQHHRLQQHREPQQQHQMLLQQRQAQGQHAHDGWPPQEPQHSEQWQHLKQQEQLQQQQQQQQPQQQHDEVLQPQQLLGHQHQLSWPPHDPQHQLLQPAQQLQHQSQQQVQQQPHPQHHQEPQQQQPCLPQEPQHGEQQQQQQLHELMLQQLQRQPPEQRQQPHPQQTLQDCCDCGLVPSPNQVPTSPRAQVETGLSGTVEAVGDEFKADVTVDREGLPWLVCTAPPAFAGRQRRLHRAVSDGCNDWTTFRDPDSGLQMVASASGLGPRYAVVKILLPPLEPILLPPLEPPPFSGGRGDSNGGSSDDGGSEEGHGGSAVEDSGVQFPDLYSPRVSSVDTDAFGGEEHRPSGGSPQAVPLRLKNGRWDGAVWKPRRCRVGFF